MYIVIDKYYTTELSSLKDVIDLFDIKISSNGKLYFNGDVDTVSYNMNEYNYEEALNSFANNRMGTMARSQGIKIYKAETI